LKSDILAVMTVWPSCSLIGGRFRVQNSDMPNLTQRCKQFVTASTIKIYYILYMYCPDKYVTELDLVNTLHFGIWYSSRPTMKDFVRMYLVQATSMIDIIVN